MTIGFNKWGDKHRKYSQIFTANSLPKHESLGSRQQVKGWNENCQSVYVHVLFSLLHSLLSSLITLGEEVFYVGVKLVICVYVNVLKVKKQFYLQHNVTNDCKYITSFPFEWSVSTDKAARLTSCTFCRSATMFVRSFCSFSSASFSLTSVLLLFSSTALALASALLWYELHNDWRPDSYCWKYSF